MLNNEEKKQIYFVGPGLGLKKYMLFGITSRHNLKLAFFVTVMFLYVALKISISFGIFLVLISVISLLVILIILYMLNKEKVIPPILQKQHALKSKRIKIFRDGPNILHFKFGRFRYFRFCYEDANKLNEIEAYLRSNIKDEK